MAVVGREDKGDGDGDGEARRGWCRAARENPDGSSSAKTRWSQASCYNYNWASPPHARSTDGRSRRERGLTVEGWTAVPGAGEWRRRFVWLHSLAHCAGGGVRDVRN